MVRALQYKTHTEWAEAVYQERLMRVLDARPDDLNDLSDQCVWHLMSIATGALLHASVEVEQWRSAQGILCGTLSD